MAKAKSVFVCQACGAQATRWTGRCVVCQTWESMVEEVSDVPVAKPKGGTAAGAGGLTVRIDDVGQAHTARITTGIGEVDRVLGGGMVPGGVVLLGGEPGIGKSTLLLQVLASVASQGAQVLYVSGEESAEQIAARARRLGAAHPNISLLITSDVGQALSAAKKQAPVVMVVDSVQTLRSEALEGYAGSVGQLREVTSLLIDYAKRANVACMLVGHVTKDGAIAGPKVIEHLVDAVLAFEGERGHPLRTVRALKNRYGGTNELGVFEMGALGLAPVDSPSRLMLQGRAVGQPGSVVAATCSGQRPVLAEVQALVTHPDAGSMRRVASGTDAQRVAMILAVLERKAGLVFGRADVFVNVVGGLYVDEPAADLAIALAVASSHLGRAVADDVVVFGELGLAGELRPSARAEERVAEAHAMGFSHVLAALHAGTKLAGCTHVATLSQALDRALH